MSIAVLEKDSVADSQALDVYAKKHSDDNYGALAHLVNGYHAYQKKKYAEAKLHFAAVSKVRGPLQDYGEYYMALSALAEGDHETSAKLLDGFSARYPTSALAAQATLRQAESLVALNRASEAILLLFSPSVKLPQLYARLLLGEAYRKDHQSLKAAEILQNIYYLNPASYTAEPAEKHLHDLKLELGESYPVPTIAMRSERADRLFAAGQWKEALNEYRSVASVASGALRDRAMIKIGDCQFHTGESQAALRTLREAAVTNPEADAERMYTAAAVYRHLDDPGAMVREVERAAQTHPESLWYEKALFLAGNYYLVNRDPTRAAEFYTRLYQQFPQGEVAPESHWRAAWRKYRERGLAEARRLFEEHIRLYPASAQVMAAIYWTGRTLETDAPAQAALFYGKLVKTFPNYYYGQVARERLEHLGSAASAESSALALPAYIQNINRPISDFALDEKNLSIASQGHRTKARLLESAWLIDLAIGELKAGIGLDEAANFFLGRELAHLEEARGRYDVALEYGKRLVTGYFSLGMDELPREDWELLFPLPWWPHIRQKAASVELDPYLVAGLIRQESEFNPEARSPSNARGLMQLMPATAQRMARQMDRGQARYFRLASLSVPEYNVAYGTFYLRQVLNQFNGGVEQALAAYNAGENRVVEWLQAGPYDEPAEFVESIPFTETREYVQAVMRNAGLYRKLYLEAAK